MTNRWLTGLNEEQQAAVLHNHGPLLILAGAGSGKTTVLVSRAGRLIEEQIVKAPELCVLTFTNKAARELKSRVQQKVGTAAKKIWAGTFHSFGLYLLRRFYKEAGLPKEFGILDPTDTHAIIRELLRDFNQGTKDSFDLEKISFLMSQAREAETSPKSNDEAYADAATWLLPRYLKRLQTLGATDFDGLILKPLELLKSNSEIKKTIQDLFHQVMVDEFQDTNLTQLRLVQALSESHQNLTVVGDDDQSIYAWRGACIRNILDFPKMYQQCNVIRLERNYRSTPEILELANASISKNSDRHGKILKPQKANPKNHKPLLLTYADETAESEFLCTEINQLLNQGYQQHDIAVLYRSNGQGTFLEAELRKNHIPYLMSGGTAFFDRKETRDVLAYLRCAISPYDVAYRRIINTPHRGIGETSVEKLHHFSETKDISFIHACSRWREADVDPKAGAAIEQFETELKELLQNISHTTAIDGTLLAFFEKIGYKTFLDKTTKDALASAKRWRFIEIFSGILKRWSDKNGSGVASLKQFIDSMELRDTLEANEDSKNKVQLMTLHASKGLEFPVVFLLGIEEDLIPHKMLGSDISEERRLFYVGITRAKEQLILTKCEKRLKQGRSTPSVPSRFLVELPKTLYDERRGERTVDSSQRKVFLEELFKKLDSIQT